MPTISRFYGIRIGMFHREHAPPHFHARYGEHTTVIGINPVSVLQGGLPRRAQSLVLEWTALHQAELVDNWRRAQNGQPLQPIDPLD